LFFLIITEPPPVSNLTLSIVIAIVVVCWALGAHNRLVRLRGHVALALRELAQAWRQQARELAASLDALKGHTTESQWASLGALGAEPPAWRPLAQANAQFLACLEALAPAAQDKPGAASPAPAARRAAIVAAVDDLSSVRAARDVQLAQWQRLRDAQQDLAGEPVPPQLQQQWATHDHLIAERLRDYNGHVERYHEAINQFPALLLAWVWGFGMTSKL
jgi:LemA protein